MPIDLRSDTVTQPTDAMRAAMAAAPVGDDQYGEDPSVNALQDTVAALLDKEAALWVPTGHMANQLALKLFTHPGDEVIVGRETHAVWHETGAGAANAGVQFAEIGAGALLTATELVAAIKPRGHAIFPPSTMVEVENTQNRAGGVVWEPAELRRIGAAAREYGLASYLDGALLLNAAVARGDDPAALAEPFDLVTVAMSKGLGAPAGSVMAGREADIEALVRYRRMLGGALRQAGILAAAGIHALEHHVERLAGDHVNARLIGERLAQSEAIEIDLGRLETNIVVFHLREGAPDAAEVVRLAGAQGVRVLAFADRTVRAVTHLDVDEDACRAGAEVLAEAAETAA